MSLARVIQTAEIALDPILDQTGGVLYSAAESVRPGDLYVMGLNPGGAGGLTIAEDLKALPERTENAYVDESWTNHTGTYQPGEAPLQRRLSWLTDQLGYDLKYVCASNLIFTQSRSADGIDFPGYADICWPVHEQIISQVRPKLLLAFGNSNVSPYAYLRGRFAGREEDIPAGHGNWRVRGFNAALAGCDIFVAGLPHLSRYSPIGKTDIVKWLKEKLSA